MAFNGSGPRLSGSHLLPLEHDISEREQDQHRGDQAGDLRQTISKLCMVGSGAPITAPCIWCMNSGPT
jgi:hypothetical protein